MVRRAVALLAALAVTGVCMWRPATTLLMARMALYNAGLGPNPCGPLEDKLQEYERRHGVKLIRVPEEDPPAGTTGTPPPPTP